MIPLLLWSQLKSMFIKDQLIRKRLYIATLFELFLPILLVIIHLWTLDDKGGPYYSSTQRRSSIVAAPVYRLDDDYYYDQTFQCYSFGESVFYTSPGSVASQIWTPDYRTCGLQTVSLDTASDVIKTWGDEIDPQSYSANTGLFFDTLDLDKGIASYSIGAQAIDYSGPWEAPDYGTYDNYLRTQSIVNILLAHYPNEANLTAQDFAYYYTTKLFPEGNPLNNELDARSEEMASNDGGDSSPVENFKFYQAYAFLEIGFLFMSTLIARRIVREKMTNSRELLRIMGLTDLIYWFSHFINYFSLSVFHGTVITIIYSIFKDKSPYSGWNPTLFWFNYVTNSVTSILFTFTLSTILARPVIGVLIVIVGRAGLAYLPFAAKAASRNIFWISPKVWASMLPSGQLQYSIYDLFYFGRTKDHAKWSDIFDSIKLDDTLSLWTVYLIAIVSWTLYFVLTWYIDAIWPWQSGTPRPWHFPVSRFFQSPPIDIELNSTTVTDDESGSGHQQNHETESGNLKPNIQCVNLYKSFGSMGAKKFAVNGLNVNILKGQITVLLGHNGAGKTTTMSMITGILKPSSGNIYVNGIDVHKDTVAARRCLALCPQHDLLFEDLTVKENLNLCAGLRGLSDSTKRQLIPLNMKRVNLEDKANSLASNLSGGMRRRLQLALALSTASEILILDEPTSGLDPESRRQLWDLLLELRKDLTILLTTHFMEEADSLGDRIIIMGSGKVKCSGSSMFLKKRFGTGYSIRVAKDAWTYQPDKLFNQIQSHFPQVQVTNETSNEVVYQLNAGLDQESSSSLADLCDTLDNNLTSLGLTSYGIAVTTLEDVFLKVADEEEEATKPTIALKMEDKLFEVDKILDYKRLNGFSLIMQRFRGLVLKRFHYTKRHLKTIAFTVILPAIVTIFTFLASSNAMTHVKTSFNDYPDPILLDLKTIYGSNAKAVIRSSVRSPFTDAYRQLMNESGVEVIQIDPSISLNDYFETSSQTREQFMDENIFGLIEDPNQPRGFTIWLNPKAALSLPLSITTWQNALIRSVNDGARTESKVTVTYKRMPNTATLEPKYRAIVARIILALFSPVAFCLIAVSYFLFPSLESQNKCNLIQKMNGIRAPMFWLSHYAFDIAYHLIVSIIIFLAIIVVDPFPFISFKAIVSIFLLLILYGLASIPLFYLFSFLPLTPDRGFSLLATISLVGTLIGSGIAASLMAFDKVESLHVIMGDLFPPFAASFGVSKLYSRITLYSECKAIDACPNGNAVSRVICCASEKEYSPFTPFSFKNGGILTEVIMLLVDACLYTLILIILDENLHRLGYWYETVRKRLSRGGQSDNGIEDEDVVSERERIKQLIASNGSASAANETLIVDGLSKQFGSLRAVDTITFGVHKAECFGLLGVNGAGKTTTFRMLTGDLMVTSGDAYLNGHSLRNDLMSFQQSISYCPQFDALLDNLTPVESLMLFARIRGMPEDKVKDNVNYIIESTDLTRFINTRNQNLSGGNKRKLSLAIASIAKPEVIFLDEPTTGVDPASRRKIWSTLIHLRDTSGSSIVLTSHSMDECEALCSRIGIMARGKFKCLGSSQHLKEKFGLGFSCTIKVKEGHSEWTEKIKRFMSEEFPSSVLRDVHQTILHYHIRDTSLRWGEMLRRLDAGKGSLPIDDFTLTGTSLEQIFLSFAKQT